MSPADLVCNSLYNKDIKCITYSTKEKCEGYDVVEYKIVTVEGIQLRELKVYPDGSFK